MFNLVEELTQLPEPIMLVGNKIPDGDSVGCLVALLVHLRFSGKEAYIHFVVEPNDTLSWMVGDGDTNPHILRDHASLVIVDDLLDLERLGLEEINDDIPIVVIDHHASNDQERLKGLGVTFENVNVKRSYISEANVLRGRGSWGNHQVFWLYSILPATACLLIEGSIFHPSLWISIFTDTARLSVNQVTAVEYLAELNLGCEESAGCDDLTDKLVEEMTQKLSKLFSFLSLQAMMQGRISHWCGVSGDQTLRVCVARIQGQEDSGCNWQVLSTIRRFSDISCIINEVTGKVSIRSDDRDFNVKDIVTEFGGGGHNRAAGCTLLMEEGSEPDDFEQAILDRFDHTFGAVFL